MSKKNTRQYSFKKQDATKSSRNPDVKERNNNALTKYPDETYFQYLRRILTVSRLTLIIGIPGAILAIYGLLPVINSLFEPEYVQIKTEINKDIEEIEKTFVLEKTISVNDTSSYSGMLNDLKEKTISFCNQWKSIENTHPYSSYLDLDYDEFKNMMTNEIERNSLLTDSLYNTIYNRIFSICIWETLVDYTHATKISEAKRIDLIKAKELKVSTDRIIYKDVIAFLELAKADSDNNRDYHANLKKAIQRYDDLKENPAHYKFVDVFLKFILDCNNMFENSKAYYKDKEEPFSNLGV